MASLDLRGQFFVEDTYLSTLRRPNVRRKLPGTVPTTDGSEEEQLRQLARGQPRKPAAILEPPEGETSVAVETMEAHFGGLKPFAGHGFHRIPEKGFDVSDLDRHGFSTLSRKIRLTTA